MMPMKTIFISLAVLLNFSTLAQAAAKPTAASPVQRTPSSADQSLEVTTVYGEKSTHFILKKSKSKAQLALSIDGQAPKEKALALADFDFIIAEYEKLPVASHIPDGCYRARMDITHVSPSGHSEQKASCLGLNTNTEPAFARFAQILVNAL